MTSSPWGQPSPYVPAGRPPRQPAYFGAPSSGRPPVLPQGPLGIGELFGATWEVLKRKAWLLLGINLVNGLVTALLMVVPAAVLVILLLVAGFSGWENPDFDPGAMLLWVVPALLLCTGAMGAIGVWTWARFGSMLAAIVDQTIRGFDASWNSAEAQTRGATGRARTLVILGAALGLVAGLILAGVFVSMYYGTTWPTDAAFGTLLVLILLLAVIGAYLQVRLVYCLPALALEGQRDMGVLRRAMALTRGRFWRTLGLLIVGGLLPFAVNATVNIANESIRDNRDLAVLSMVTGLLGAVLNLVVGVWTTIWQMLMYVDVRRHEAAGQAPTPPASVEQFPPHNGFPQDAGQQAPLQQATPQLPQPAPGQWQAPGYPEPQGTPTPPPPAAPPASGASHDDNPWARRDGEGL